MEKDVEESKNETGTTEYFNKIHVVFYSRQWQCTKLHNQTNKITFTSDRARDLLETLTGFLFRLLFRPL